MIRYASAAIARLPTPSRMATPPPRSSQTIDMRSITIEMMTIGNRETDNPVSVPIWSLMMLIAVISSTTMVTTAASRGTSSRRRRSI